jgi:quinol monooxygenase YgiN
MLKSRRALLLSTAGGVVLAGRGWSADDGGSIVRGDADDQVFELRQYTLHRGQRDTLIDLFERSFIETQNELGAHVIGTFRDLDDPDRFVWIRGFRDMPVRQKALSAFYDGPVWRAKRAAANSTMLDSSNVLLLRPAEAGQALRSQPAGAPASTSVLGVTIYYLGGVDAAQFTHFFDQAVAPQLAAAGVHPIARLVSEESPNTFTRLPIRQRDRVFVWLTRWPNLGAEEVFVSNFRALSGWRDSAPEAVLPALMQKPERLRLAPTTRSPLR